MSKRAITRLVKYGCSSLFVIASAVIYVASRYTPNATTLQWYHWLCDSLTLPSMLLISAGVILWVSNAGALDALGYAGRFVIQMFLPASKKRYGTYGDYVLEKQEKRIKGYGFLLITGAISMAVNLVFLALYLVEYSAQATL